VVQLVDRLTAINRRRHGDMTKPRAWILAASEVATLLRRADRWPSGLSSRKDTPAPNLIREESIGDVALRHGHSIDHSSVGDAHLPSFQCVAREKNSILRGAPRTSP
jgi:hypothetical protein